MLFNQFLTTFAAKEVENTNLFPFPFKLHLIFAVVGFLFFAFRFITDKRPFQLIFAIAIPFSLLLWVFTGKVAFYTIGAVELALIIIALISCFIFKKPEPAKAAENAPAENNAEANAEATGEPENSVAEAADSEE